MFGVGSFGGTVEGGETRWLVEFWCSLVVWLPLARVMVLVSGVGHRRGQLDGSVRCHQRPVLAPAHAHSHARRQLVRRRSARVRPTREHSNWVCVHETGHKCKLNSSLRGLTRLQILRDNVNNVVFICYNYCGYHLLYEATLIFHYLPENWAARRWFKRIRTVSNNSA